MTLRRVLFWLHLVVGMTVGLVIALLATTGSMLELQAPAVHWAERAAHPAAAAQQGCVAPSVVLQHAAAFQHASPKELTLYADPQQPAEVAFDRSQWVLVDRCSGRVLGAGANKVRGFFQATLELHRGMVLDGVPHEWLRRIKNIAVVGFLFLIVSGLILWFPRNVSWQRLRRGVLLRRELAGRARSWNRHTVIGFWMSAPLAVVALTGIIMAYPWANALLFRLAGSAPPPPHSRMDHRLSASFPVDQLPSLDMALRTAIAQDSKWKRLSLRLPAGRAAAVSFTLDEGSGGRPSQAGQLVVARNSGQLLRWLPFSANSRGRQWRMDVRFLHTGELFGIPGQLIVLLAMGAALMLVWTGFSLAFRRLTTWKTRRGRA